MSEIRFPNTYANAERLLTEQGIDSVNLATVARLWAEEGPGAAIRHLRYADKAERKVPGSEAA